jgi:predicted GIY-YIG superfamily endonuclease
VDNSNLKKNCSLNTVNKYSDMQADKARIYKENRNKTGIYLITNKINGKKYLGSSKNLKARFAHYFSDKAIHFDNMPICKALLKYGRSFFTLEIIEYCDPEVRFKRETCYLKLLKPEYNIILEATPFSPETILKMSANHPRSAKILVHDLVTGSQISYNSIRHVAESLGFCRASVSNYSLKSIPYLDRYIFKRVDKFRVSLFETPSLVYIGTFLNKIEANLEGISKELAQLKSRSKYISKKSAQLNVSKSQGISPETVLKMSANNPKSVGVLVHDLKTETKKNYTSFRQAGLSLGISPVTIKKYSLASSPYLGRYIFEIVTLEALPKTDISLTSSDIVLEMPAYSSKSAAVANSSKSTRILVHDLVSNSKKKYTSIRHAAVSLGLSRGTIVNYTLKSTPFLGRYIFKKIAN